MNQARFEWDSIKADENLSKHKVSFMFAQRAFLDPNRVIIKDFKHSLHEERFYCMGRVGDDIITVRFTYRGQVIRLIGAGYWREGRTIYEEKNSLHK